MKESLKKIKKNLTVKYTFAGLFQTEEKIHDALFKPLSELKRYSVKLNAYPLNTDNFVKVQKKFGEFRAAVNNVNQTGGVYGRFIASKGLVSSVAVYNKEMLSHPANQNPGHTYKKLFAALTLTYVEEYEKLINESLQVYKKQDEDIYSMMEHYSSRGNYL